MARRLVTEEGLFCGGTSGAIVAEAVRYAKAHKLGRGHRIVCILPDTIRNYMTKHAALEWMVEKGYADPSVLRDENHKYKHIKLADMKFKEVKCFDATITIAEALQQFSEGAMNVVIVENNTIQGVVTKQKLMNAMTTRSVGLKDKATCGLTNEFSQLPYDKIDFTILERILKKAAVTYLTKKSETGDLIVYEATQQDIFDVLLR